jgi:hypothetical protein
MARTVDHGLKDDHLKALSARTDRFVRMASR